MPEIAQSAAEMIGGMTPRLRPGVFVFASLSDPARAAALAPQAIASFHEDEGLSLVLPLDVAQQAGLDVAQPMRCITLNVYSALDGVGLTAAVAGALARHAIPCNVIAAFHHDHVFVPAETGARAVEVLETLQHGSTTGETEDV